MITFYAESHALHNPPHEFFEGQLIPYQESPRRVEIILQALRQHSAGPILPPHDHGLAPIQHVHDAGYLAWLQAIYADWVRAGGIESGATADTFALRGLPHKPISPKAAHGYYAMDATSVIAAHTWRAAYDSAQCALSAVAAVLDGSKVAYALCRPPGHHAHAAHCGGYCFINNAALTAEFGARRGAKVSVLDIDFHHGNGTQDIFYRRSDVQFVSIHADPERHYPYFSGGRDERGDGPGTGFTCNYPLEAGIDDDHYLLTLARACEDVARYRPELLVVSLGLDTFTGDPLGDFAVSTRGFSRIGAALAGLNLPMVFVQEGGYSIEALGENVAAVLCGFENR